MPIILKNKNPLLLQVFSFPKLLGLKQIVLPRSCAILIGNVREPTPVCGVHLSVLYLCAWTLCSRLEAELRLC